MAQRSVEGISHQTVAHGVQAGQPCLTYPFAADRESSFMKAGYGKTVRPVCAADGGKLFIGRLLRPDRTYRCTHRARTLVPPRPRTRRGGADARRHGEGAPARGFAANATRTR